MTTGITAAIEKMGTQTALADAAGVTQQTVSGWLKRGHMPLMQALKVERLTGVSRHKLVSSHIAKLIK
jgi:DNA-binding transcriptional regulator YdaS (Cro superfamily)